MAKGMERERQGRDGEALKEWTRIRVVGNCPNYVLEALPLEM